MSLAQRISKLRTRVAEILEFLSSPFQHESKPPLVSVVITTYYRNEALRRAIASVREQTYDRIEILVVDGSGEAHARPVCEEQDVSYIAQSENKGILASRSRGIEEAAGRHVALLDDDDRFAPEKIEKQVAVMKRRPDVGVVYCGIKRPGGKTILPDPRIQGNALTAFLTFKGVPCLPSTILIRQSVAAAVFPLGGRNLAEDIIMNIELARRAQFAFVDEALVETTDFDESRSTSLKTIEGRWEILKEYDELYDVYPPEVRRKAIADTHLNKANLLLGQRLWSGRAIISAAKAAYFVPGWNALFIGYMLAALLGRLGVNAGRYLHERFILGDTQRGIKI